MIKSLRVHVYLKNVFYIFDCVKHSEIAKVKSVNVFRICLLTLPEERFYFQRWINNYFDIRFQFGIFQLGDLLFVSQRFGEKIIRRFHSFYLSSRSLFYIKLSFRKYSE